MFQISKNLNILLFVFSIVFFISFSFVSNAGVFRFESETSASGRKNSADKSEFPIYETIESSYLGDQYNLHTYFNLFGDPVSKTYDFQLLSLNGSYRFNDKFSMSLGRVFNSYYLTRAATIDTVTFEINPISNLNFYVYGGKQSQLELRKVALETQIKGLGFNYTTPQVYPWKVGGRIESFDYQNNPHKETLAKWTLSKQFSFFLDPEFMFVDEYDVQTNKRTKTQFGVDLFPNYKSYLSLKTSCYNPSPTNGWEQPVATIFSAGEITEHSARWTQIITPQVSASINGATSRFRLVDSTDSESSEMANGKQLGLDVDVQFRNEFGASDQIFYFDSYGGKALGNSLKLDYQIRSGLNFLFNSDVVKYEKITSSNRTAYSTEVGFGRNLADKFRLHLLFQYSQNNQVSKEYSILARLFWLEWQEI